MSDSDHEFDELRRRLAEQGQATAPGDLAGEVMRRVQAEPRRRPRRSLRPVLVPLAAALLVAAGVVGVTRLGSGSASSSGAGTAAISGGGQALSTEKSPTPSSAHTPDTRSVVHGVALDRAGTIFGFMPQCRVRDSLSVSIPNAIYGGVFRNLRRAAGEPSADSPRVDVYLRHAPKTQTRIRVTCP